MKKNLTKRAWRALTASVLGGLLAAGAWLTPSEAAMLKGGDVSCYNYVIHQGGVFRDAEGRARDGLAILRANGMNFVRIRNYNTPGKGHGDGTYYCPAGYLDLKDNLDVARRAKALGMKIEYSFHYSDYWTNGSLQIIPSDWQKKIAGLDDAAAIDVLEQCVYDYTKEACRALKAQGTPPEYVSLGNEIQHGMLFPYGRAAKASWPTLARFFNAGAKAVREELPEAKIILHLDDAGNDDKYENFFGSCQRQGVDYDIIGTSYYPFYLKKDVKTVADFCEHFGKKYQRPIMIMETGYSWTDKTAEGRLGQLAHNGPYPDTTKEGQRAFMQELYETLGNLKDVQVLGDLYWDPIFIAKPGAIGWAQREADDKTEPNVIDNTTWFDFDGRPLPVQRAANDTLAEDGESIVTGYVRGAGGHGIAGARVTLVASSGDGATLSGETDRYGGYFFRDVPAGRYEIQATASGYDAAGGCVVTAARGTAAEADDVVMEGRQLRGQVLDDAGLPVAGARVSYVPEGDRGTWDVTTAADGTYEITDVPHDAAGELHVTAAGCNGTGMHLAAAQDLVNLVVEKTSGTITGTVVNEYGGPVADAVVTATAANGRTTQGKTDDQGRYAIPDAPADVPLTIAVACDGFLPQTKETATTVAVRGTEDASFQLARNAFALSGTVQTSAGAPAAGATVKLASSDGTSYETQTDAEGRYAFAHVLGGRSYELCASVQGETDAVVDDVTAEPGTAKTLDVRAPIPVALANPSFETWGKDKYDVVGWTAEGTKNVFDQQAPGRTGQMNLAAWNEGAYASTLHQELDLPAGTYTITCYTMNGGGQDRAELYLTDSTGERHAAVFPASPGNWQKVTLQATIPAGRASLGFDVAAKPGCWFCVDDVQLVRSSVAE
ncbi:MAG: glycosyl hydrolase 53 family protein [Selenomonadaceae bacterium]|nr:glycosyl hydrolase 53 family protein [Selenomonadaceae bacterium]